MSYKIKDYTKLYGDGEALSLNQFIKKLKAYADKNENQATELMLYIGNDDEPVTKCEITKDKYGLVLNL